MVCAQEGQLAAWLLMASPKFTTTKNMHSNEVESLVYGFVLRRCRDPLNSSECKPELMMIVVSSSSLFVWEPAVCKPTTLVHTVLDCVHAQVCWSTEQSCQCKSWPAGETEVGCHRVQTQYKTIVPNVKTA